MNILDVGCGNNKFQRAIGVDLYLDTQADVICNLNNYIYPFRDNTFDLIICKQIIEHIPDTDMFLKELRRIANNNAKIIIETPHFSSYMAYGDYQHCHTFSVFSLDKLADRIGFKILKKGITFHRAFRRYKIGWLANKFPLSYERFWAFILPAEHLHFELEVVK